MKKVITSNNKLDTINLGKSLGSILSIGDVVTLTGDLGAGKTTLVSGVAKSLKIKDTIQSPTFNILKCYFDGKIPLYHIDAYRLEEVNKDIGLEEYIEGNGLAFIEWPIFIKELLNIPHLEIEIKNKGNDKREITLRSNYKHYIELIRRLK